MLNVSVTRDPNRTLAVLEGVFDQSVDLGSQIGPTAKTLRLSCGGIKRFNSVGIKNWVMYFEERRRTGTELEFTECSPAVVEVANTYRNFLAGGRIISIQIPYLCASCGNHFVKTKEVAALQSSNFDTPNEPCSACGKPGSFDDLPDTYFGFLKG